MKIYTKTGDRGTTSLFGGQRVEKTAARIATYGTVDELNSMLGAVGAEMEESKVKVKSQSRTDSGQARMTRQILRIQGELMVMGSNLAKPKNPTSLKLRGASKIPKITKSYITRLEKEIDNWEKGLAPLKNFILPGGSKAGATLHLARAVARRAERLIVDLDRTEKLDRNLLIYINRLSDWLFVAARYVNKLEKYPERIWKGREKSQSRKSKRKVN